tara:strand:- start:1414 stop:2559 length:1146 start_codon:yes stop_codon:yes gene_type:complete
MAQLLDINTTVPNFSNSKESLMKFYVEALNAADLPNISKKMSFLLDKTKIDKRYSCIPDFHSEQKELFKGKQYNQSIERRMEVYKDKIMPLAIDAIGPLLIKNEIKSTDITHLITVSCTGLYAPGLEFALADHFDLQHTEKLAVNFLGCYAGVKALKHAYYIAQAEPNACILIVSAELCTLHFQPSVVDEDVIANLLFADGAAASIVCGNDNKHLNNKVTLTIDSIGSACIPDTSDLMTWDLGSAAFKMYLSRKLVDMIGENIAPIVDHFLARDQKETDYWAIHPGGIRIVEEVRDRLGLTNLNVEDSMQVLKEYGNMSSPTILFILNRILTKIRNSESPDEKSVFACAFGPGLTVEMIHFTSLDHNKNKETQNKKANYAV